MPTEAIQIESLSHRYPSPKRRRRSAQEASVRTLALDGISFTVHCGELFGILGPNGGGKTTLFRILSTMLRPSANTDSSAKLMGHDVLAEPAMARRQLGVVFQSPSLDGKLTAVENLRHHGRLYGLSSKELDQRIDQWLTFFSLSERRNELVERFSGGMRRRLEVAKALLNKPKLLLMDEPATGLDPAARRDLWQKLLQLRHDTGMTIVLTTHLMDEAERCDRLAIMAEGKLVTVDSPANLRARIGGDVISVEPEPDSNGTEALMQQITDRFGPWKPGAVPTLIDGRIRFEIHNGPRILTELASAFPGQIRSFTTGRPTLEDVFMHLTGASLSADQL